ncbi:hypothetical protein [Actinokineospora sp.]|uniref:hypothetical protein n=1 Tax=Actinokineospora sp. TaxID=1872133 RepID=UPI004037E3BA
MPSTTTAWRAEPFGTECLRLADQITVALTRLPARRRLERLRKLAVVLAHQKRTGDMSAVEHFIESLVMTERMERDPDYVLAMAGRERPGRARDIEDVIAALEARDSEPGT